MLPTCRMVSMDQSTAVAHVPHAAAPQRNKGGHRSSRRIQFHAMVTGQLKPGTLGFFPQGREEFMLGWSYVPQNIDKPTEGDRRGLTQ